MASDRDKALRSFPAYDPVKRAAFLAWVAGAQAICAERNRQWFASPAYQRHLAWLADRETAPATEQPATEAGR